MARLLGAATNSAVLVVDPAWLGNSHAHQPCYQSSMVCLSPLTPPACCAGSHTHCQASTFDAAELVTAAQPCTGALGPACCACQPPPTSRQCRQQQVLPTSSALCSTAWASVPQQSTLPAKITNSVLMGAHAGMQISLPDLPQPGQPRRSALSPRWHAAMSGAPEWARGAG